MSHVKVYEVRAKCYSGLRKVLQAGNRNAKGRDENEVGCDRKLNWKAVGEADDDGGGKRDGPGVTEDVTRWADDGDL